MGISTTRWIAIGAAALLGACAGDTAQVDDPFAGGRWVDLTHSFSSDAIYWPTAGGFQLQVDAEGVTEQGYYYASNSYSASEHGGTHLDAPIHFAEGRRFADEIPIEQLIGPAAVVDVSAGATGDRDYQVTVADIENWESEHGRLPDGAILLLNTGSHRFWPDRSAYMGTDELGPDAVALLHFPGLDPTAARWLVAERNIGAVGLDTPSIDYGQSTLFESHQILFDANIPAFENVAALDELPPSGAHVVALPMKIEGGSGAPLRVIAWVATS